MTCRGRPSARRNFPGLLSLVVAVGCALGCGCRPKASLPPMAGDVVELTIAGETIRAEIANDRLSRERGLMGGVVLSPRVVSPADFGLGVYPHRVRGAL